MIFPKFLIRKKLVEFLEEDLSMGDVTNIPDCTAKAAIISKDNGIIAGVEVARIAFDIMNLNVINSIEDGSKIRYGDVVMEVEGKAKDILMCERTVLNILMRMSGIATTTARMVEIARKVNPDVVVAATRKTTPGFRIFEKMAVYIGGGDMHRFSLGDCVLIKNNHVAIAGSLVEAIKFARAASFTKKIEVEVRSVEEALTAAREGVDIIMFDNMSPSEIREAVKALEKEGLRERVILEASGGITPDNVEEYASTGVDVLSSGFLTHSSKVLDLSLKIVEVKR
jgi:nicotinate-nucleotide pyrophosphorylase (carboxylating)